MGLGAAVTVCRRRCLARGRSWGMLFSERLSRGALLLFTIDPRVPPPHRPALGEGAAICLAALRLSRALSLLGRGFGLRFSARCRPLPHRPCLGEYRVRACCPVQECPPHRPYLGENRPFELEKRALTAHRPALGEKCGHKVPPWESGREGPRDLPAEMWGGTSTASCQFLPGRHVTHGNQKSGSQNAVFLPTRDDVREVGGGDSVLRGCIAMKRAVRGSACAWRRPRPLRRSAPSRARCGCSASALRSRPQWGSNPWEGERYEKTSLAARLKTNGWAVRGSNPRPWD